MNWKEQTNKIQAMDGLCNFRLPVGETFLLVLLVRRTGCLAFVSQTTDAQASELSCL